MTSPLHSLRVFVSPNEAETGAAAGKAAATALRRAIEERGEARVILASAPSQGAMLAALVEHAPDWGRIHAFHMDEYVGIDPKDPRSFSRWLADRLPVDRLASFETIDPLATPAAESRRYEALLREKPIDVTLMGFGMNGHLAFNEPGTDMDDPLFVRPVELARASREQQVIDGLFRRIDDTPTHAVSLTVPALMSASTVISTVVNRHKAQAVVQALYGPYTPDCPASAIRFHPDAMLFLDAAAASELPTPARSAAA